MIEGREKEGGRKRSGKKVEVATYGKRESRMGKRGGRERERKRKVVGREKREKKSGE